MPDQRPDWNAHFAREQARYRDGEARLPGTAEPDARQRRLTRLGNAAGGAGLALLMAGRREEAGAWFDRAATRYRESFADAPPDSWGRPIGAMKARILAGDWQGAADDARWALATGAPAAESPIGRYAAALACLVLEDDGAGRSHADALLERDDFPGDVGDALAAIAAHDRAAYAGAVTAVTASFEARDEYLEDVPVADTTIVLQALAARRGLEMPLASALLPSN